MEREKTRRNEWILIAVVLAVAAAAMAVFHLSHSEESAWVEVSVDGELYRQLALSQDQELLIEGKGGGTNRLVIEDGQAWITQASCPDKICESMGKISRSGQTITCLPNRVVVEIAGDGDSQEDSVDGVMR